MKQRTISLMVTIVTVALVALAAVAVPAVAQDQPATPEQDQDTQTTPYYGMGPGMMNGFGVMGRPYGYGAFGFMPGMMAYDGCLGAGAGFMANWGGLQQAQTVADSLDMDLADYLSARQEGRTIAAIAEEQGVRTGDLVTAVMDARQPLIDAAVEAGLMTQADADWLMTETESAFRARLENPTATSTCAGMFGQFFGATLLDTAAQALEMDRQELLNALQDGQTLGDLLDESDIDAESEVIQPLLELERQNLEPLVESGQMTSAQMDAILVQTRTRLMQLLDVSGTDLGYGYRPGLGYGPSYGYNPSNMMGWGYNYLPQYNQWSWNDLSGMTWDDVNSWWNSLP